MTMLRSTRCFNPLGFYASGIQGIIPESHFQGACDRGAWSKKGKGKGFAFSKNISNHTLMFTIF